MKIILLNSEERKRLFWRKYLVYRTKSKTFWTIEEENDLIDHLKESKEAGEMFEEEIRKAARDEAFISKFLPYPTLVYRNNFYYIPTLVYRNNLGA